MFILLNIKSRQWHSNTHSNDCLQWTKYLEDRLNSTKFNYAYLESFKVIQNEKSAISVLNTSAISILHAH